MDLSVLSYNIMGCIDQFDEHRYKNQVAAVKALNADIICLQEAWDQRVIDLYQKNFQDHVLIFDANNTIPILLKPLLLAYAKGKSLREIFLGNDFGLVFLVRKGLINGESIKVRRLKNVSSEHGIVKIFDYLKPKGFAEINIKYKDIPIFIINAHLSVGTVNPKRMLQIKTIEKEIKRLPNASMILCIDSNSDGKQPEMVYLRETIKLKDSFLEQFPNPNQAPHGGYTWNNDNPLTQGYTKEPNQRCDFIFYRPCPNNPMTLIKANIVLDGAPYLSDHYGILSQFNI